jgi:hypothetical protein
MHADGKCLLRGIILAVENSEEILISNKKTWYT